MGKQIMSLWQALSLKMKYQLAKSGKDESHLGGNMKGSYSEHIAPKNTDGQHNASIAKKETYTAYGKWVKVVKAPHACITPTTLPDDAMEGSIWQCDECKTRWIYTGTIYHGKYAGHTFEKEGEYTSTYQDDAYCVVCKEKVFIENRKVKISDSGRRMAQGNCGKCGTKVNRILGKAR